MLVNLGNIYTNRFDLVKAGDPADLHRANDAYTEALALAREIHDLDCESRALTSMGRCRIYMPDAVDGIQLLKSGHSLAIKTRDVWLIAHTSAELGRAFYAARDLKTAKQHLLFALARAEQFDYADLQVLCALVLLKIAREGNATTVRKYERIVRANRWRVQRKFPELVEYDEAAQEGAACIE